MGNITFCRFRHIPSMVGLKLRKVHVSANCPQTWLKSTKKSVDMGNFSSKFPLRMGMKVNSDNESSLKSVSRHLSIYK